MSARVLVVDDVLSNVKLLQGRLTAEYFEVMTATNGEEALAVANKSIPDIVLLDVMMPGMDGPATFQNLRQLPGLERTPGIFMTAKVMRSEVQRFLEIGAIGVLAKPFDPMTLSDQLRKIWDDR